MSETQHGMEVSHEEMESRFPGLFDALKADPKNVVYCGECDGLRSKDHECTGLLPLPESQWRACFVAGCKSPSIAISSGLNPGGPVCYMHSWGQTEEEALKNQAEHATKIAARG